mmetsp:Transcript_29433/g.44561  ORF Transcript_29433/g.44561 Transcript_29433/m.44561 type:complete len:118 (-) Transcript_29433:1312-1665(-)
MAYHKSLTDNLRNIHKSAGSYKDPRMLMPDEKGQFKEIKPIFRGQKIFLDDYKKILEDRRKMTIQQKSYVIQNKMDAFKPIQRPLQQKPRILEQVEQLMKKDPSQQLPPKETKDSKD